MLDIAKQLVADGKDYHELPDGSMLVVYEDGVWHETADRVKITRVSADTWMVATPITSVEKTVLEEKQILRELIMLTQQSIDEIRGKGEFEWDEYVMLEELKTELAGYQAELKKWGE